MDKYSHYYLNDFNDRYEAFNAVDADGEWYRVADVEAMTGRLLADKNARIADLEKALKKCHAVLSGLAMSKAELIDALEGIKNCELMEIVTK